MNFEGQLDHYMRSDAAVDASLLGVEAVENIKNNSDRNLVFKSGRITQEVEFGPV